MVWKPVNTKVHQNSSAHIPCQASFAVNKTDLVYVWYFNNRLLDIVNEPSLIVVSDWTLSTNVWDWTLSTSVSDWTLSRSVSDWTLSLSQPDHCK